MIDKYKIDEFLLRLLNNEISKSDFVQLKEWMATDSNAISYYCMFLSDYVLVRKQVESEFDIQDDLLTDPEVMAALGQKKKTAPVIENPKEKPQRELLQTAVYTPREKKKLSTFSKVALAMNAAAILFFVFFFGFAPSGRDVEVVTLTDSINAKWSGVRHSLKKGARLYTGKTSFMLKEGLVKLKFDNNTQVTIEGPASFQILDDDMIKLNYGQLYSQVPAEAYGFQISTQHAKLIDLGTEFGVKEVIDGNTEVHVFKGQVNLISNILSKKINIDLPAGSAQELNSATGELKKIKLEKNLFARQIDSKTNIIWRGQNSLDLADIVGGGNGLGTGEIGKGISLTNGSCVSDFNWTYGKGTGQYLNVDELPFVDGVIVPDSKDGTLQVSSKGHLFKECPDTSGIYYDEIRNGGLIHMNEPKISIPMEFNKKQYGTSEKPILFMNTNAGITFDLGVIRGKLPGISVKSFRSGCLLFAIPNKRKVQKSDIFVLVDGETKFKKIGFDQDGVVLNIDIPLTESDRFLTLVATDGGDSIALDWVGFVEPCIILDTD